MPQARFAYDAPANDCAGPALSLSLFADRVHLRGQVRDDALAAGLRLAEESGLEALLDDRLRALGDVVLADCPQVDAATLAALSRLDIRAAHCGARLIVSTSVAALDDVFACLDQSGAEILVDPGRTDRIMAFGRALARLPGTRLRELSEEDRILLLRLTEQVGQLARRIDRIDGQGAGDRAGPAGVDGGAFRFEAAKRAFSGQGADTDGDRLVRATRPALPDPRLIRRIIRQRQLRARFFDADLFADPAWDMTPKIFGNSNVFKEAA